MTEQSLGSIAFEFGAREVRSDQDGVCSGGVDMLELTESQRRMSLQIPMSGAGLLTCHLALPV